MYGLPHDSLPVYFILHIKYTVDMVTLRMYIAWFVVIAAPYVRSVILSLYTITLFMTISNDQWTILYSRMFIPLKLNISRDYLA